MVKNHSLTSKNKIDISFDVRIFEISSTNAVSKISVLITQDSAIIKSLSITLRFKCYSLSIPIDLRVCS
ncbi:hypothetical protein D3C86_1332560 [compost metagenome]